MFSFINKTGIERLSAISLGFSNNALFEKLYNFVRGSQNLVCLMLADRICFKVYHILFGLDLFLHENNSFLLFLSNGLLCFQISYI